MTTGWFADKKKMLNANQTDFVTKLHLTRYSPESVMWLAVKQGVLKIDTEVERQYSSCSHGINQYIVKAHNGQYKTSEITKALCACESGIVFAQHLQTSSPHEACWGINNNNNNKNFGNFRWLVYRHVHVIITYTNKKNVYKDSYLLMVLIFRQTGKKHVHYCPMRTQGHNKIHNYHSTCLFTQNSHTRTRPDSAKGWLQLN